jgi:hypothetical protein
VEEGKRVRGKGGGRGTYVCHIDPKKPVCGLWSARLARRAMELGSLERLWFMRLS